MDLNLVRVVPGKRESRNDILVTQISWIMALIRVDFPTLVTPTTIDITALSVVPTCQDFL